MARVHFETREDAAGCAWIGRSYNSHSSHEPLFLDYSFGTICADKTVRAMFDNMYTGMYTYGYVYGMLYPCGTTCLQVDESYEVDVYQPQGSDSVMVNITAATQYVTTLSPPLIPLVILFGQLEDTDGVGQLL